MIQYETRIARRGKGAKGSVEVKVWGKPILDDNGIAKGFDYSELKDTPEHEAMNIAVDKGYSIPELLFRAMDMIEKSAAIKAQNYRGELNTLIARSFNLSDSEDDKKTCKAKTDAVLHLVKVTNYTIEEAIELMKKSTK